MDDDLDAEVRERTLAEVATLRLVDLLTAAEGLPLTVRTTAATVRGVLRDAGADWLQVGDTVVAAIAVTAVEGLPPRAERPGPVRGRLTLGYALRRLARTEFEVVVTTRDTRTQRGRLTRVGNDFAEVDGRAIPFTAIVTVSPAP